MINRLTRLQMTQSDRAIYDTAPTSVQQSARWTLVPWVEVGILSWALFSWQWQPLIAFALLQVATILGGIQWLKYKLAIRRVQRETDELQ